MSTRLVLTNLPDRAAAERLAGHPYELPEGIAVPIGRGLPAYLAWIAAETNATRD